VLHMNPPFRVIRFIDESHSIDRRDPLWNHAVDEAIANAIAKGLKPPTIRCWRYDRAVMLGRRDMRLPDMANAMEWLTNQGFDVAVRPCGGTGVPLTEDVLNISLLFPTNDYIQFPLDGAFEFMANLLIQALAPIANVTAGEVHGSYCPGDFDLSIDGYKIAGIAQRRIMGAIIIQAYLLVRGNGRHLFSLMQQMYEIAGFYKVSETRRPLPSLDTETNRSIQEITGTAIEPEQIAQCIAKTVEGTLAIEIVNEPLSELEVQKAHKERLRFAETLKLQAINRSIPIDR
jgi:octanoyl-[GcvH]:protein N-octanoyltransferase